MNVPSVASKPLSEWVDGMRFREKLEDVLTSLKNDSKLATILARKKIKFEDNDAGVWVGIYGNAQDFWVGFCFTPGGEKRQLLMHLQKAVEGNRVPEFEKLSPVYGGTLNPEFAKGRTWLNLRRGVDGELDGSGERIRDWLTDSAKWLLELK